MYIYIYIWLEESPRIWGPNTWHQRWKSLESRGGEFVSSAREVEGTKTFLRAKWAIYSGYFHPEKKGHL